MVDRWRSACAKTARARPHRGHRRAQRHRPIRLRAAGEAAPRPPPSRSHGRHGNSRQREAGRGHPVRALHVRASGLVRAGNRAAGAGDDGRAHREDLDFAIDDLRRRYGNTCVVRGAELGRRTGRHRHQGRERIRRMAR
ncbi:MAG: hypothetical protein ACLSVD_04145 [Eggerthellaceae bacterium]